MTTTFQSLPILALVLAICPCHLWSAAQQRAPYKVGAAVASALPDAPAPQQDSAANGSASLEPPETAGALPVAKKYDPVIEPGQVAPRLSVGDKLVFSMREQARIVNIFSALYSTGYEQLTNDDPKYGSDAGAGAMRFGASMLLSSSTRLFSDGVFAAAFHQDPRYHRVAYGSLFYRTTHSAARALLRHSDDGPDQINISGLAGRAAAAALTLAYYPAPSRNARVVATTFGVSIATDAGGDLVLEFLPDLARKFPFLKKVQFR